MSSKEEALPADVDAGVQPAPSMAMLPWAQIVVSKTNPRTHFDMEYILELGASIREHGILQPILVRPLPAARLADTFADREAGQPLPTHEIVAGECRWRGWCEAGLGDTAMPVLIRHLTDLQVLQVQLVENLKRRDLHPLEEAEGFERLRNDHGMTVEDIAAKVDKSTAQIYVTLKLLELTPECRKELYAGKLTRSTALLVARAPAHLQVQIAKDIMQPQGLDGEPMSYRQAQRHIHQAYMLQLAHAVFDIKDASLVAKAGDCTSCAKNTGAHTDLFSDVKGGDTCTDPKCFDAKKVAHFAKVAKAAEAKGQTVIQGKEAAALYAYEGAEPKGYKLLDGKDYINGTYTSARKAIGKDNLPTPVLIIDPHTKLPVEALPIEVANKLLAKAKGAKVEKKKDAEPTESELQDQFKLAWHDKAVTQLHAAIMAGSTSGITVDLARHIAMYYSQSMDSDAAERFTKLFNVPAAKVGRRDGIDEYLKTCPDSMVGPALLVLMAEDDLSAWNATEFPIASLLAKDAGFDLDAIQSEVKAQMKEAAAARKAEAAEKAASKATPAKKTPAKPKKTTAADAQAGISKALQAAQTLKGFPGITAEVTEALTKAGITDLDTLADSTVDELVEITCLSDTDARAVIMKAREGWFDGDKGKAAPAFAIGDQVRFKQGLKGPNGKARKVCGREGYIDHIQTEGAKPSYGVRTGSKPSDYANAELDEIELVKKGPPTGPIKTKAAKKSAPAASAAEVKLKGESAWPWPTAQKPA
jgi:ParB/RepB/Spo0J family partition protein